MPFKIFQASCGMPYPVYISTKQLEHEFIKELEVQTDFLGSYFEAFYLCQSLGKNGQKKLLEEFAAYFGKLAIYHHRRVQENNDTLHRDFAAFIGNHLVQQILSELCETPMLEFHLLKKNVPDPVHHYLLTDMIAYDYASRLDVRNTPGGQALYRRLWQGMDTSRWLNEKDKQAMAGIYQQLILEAIKKIHPETMTVAALEAWKAAYAEVEAYREDIATRNVGRNSLG